MGLPPVGVKSPAGLDSAVVMVVLASLSVERLSQVAAPAIGANASKPRTHSNLGCNRLLDFKDVYLHTGSMVAQVLSRLFCTLKPLVLPGLKRAHVP